jgi:alpha-galactosidase
MKIFTNGPMCLCCLVAAVAPAGAVAAANDELTLWMGMHFGSINAASRPTFSFVYGGKPFAEVLKGWKVESEMCRLDGQRTQHTHIYRDPKTGLEVRCVAFQYSDFPTIEWTLYFKNTGDRDTSLLENIQALDASFFTLPAAGEFLLHHHAGSSARVEDYQPLETTLGPKAEKRFAPTGGRGSNGTFPYFNLEWPVARAPRGGTAASEGVIVAVGWPGQWAASFTRDIGLRVRAGQEKTHFILHPGEEVRSPLIVLQFWRGDWIGAQNTWRRWMIAHNLPRVSEGPKPPVLPGPQLAACSSHQFGEMIGANEANQILFVDRYLEEGLKIDYWWMDAGWYKNNGTWVNTGTWEVDPKRFPRGLRAITDHAHARGVKSIVWFEPERVTPGSWLYTQHPEWLLTPPPNPGGQAYDKEWRLLDLGNPKAWAWLTEHVDGLITSQGIDLYRQDFNIDPLLYWRAHDAADRQGITEIRYVTGYLAYWDELRRRHPMLRIDSCASGGRRNDLESMRRAVPLTRSDYLFEPVGEQCHTYGIAFWIPYYGTGTLAGPSKINPTPAAAGVDSYVFRSDMCPSMTACWDLRVKDLDYRELRRLAGQFRQVAVNYLGDYYPLTPYSMAQRDWMAWQFDRPEEGRGVVQAFRRAQSTQQARRLPLRGLDPRATYVVRDFDALDKATEASGSDLIKEGLSVSIRGQPGAVIFTYQRK